MSVILVNAEAGYIPLGNGVVHCSVSSPPYFSLRAYQGDQARTWPEASYAPMPGLPKMTIPAMHCALGHEESPEAFIGHLVACYREVWRVLRDDGVCWINIGDSFAQGVGLARGKPYKRHSSMKSGLWAGTRSAKRDIGNEGVIRDEVNLKPGDLMLIPHRLALALQGDGWTVRNDCVWQKVAPMPESVRGWTFQRHRVTIEYYEKMQELQSSSTRRGIQAESRSVLSGVRETEGEGISQDGSLSAGATKVSSEQERHNGDKSLRADARSERAAASSQSHTSCEGESEAIRSNRKGKEDAQAGAKEVLPDRKRADQREGSRQAKGQNHTTETVAKRICQTLPGADVRGTNRKGKGTQSSMAANRSGQAMVSPQGTLPQDAKTIVPESPDELRMERDQETAQESLLLLQAQDEKSNDGSCDSSKQRGNALKGKYSSGMSDLQFEEKGQDNTTLLVDCPGCPRCESTGGYVLRRGSWRHTRAHEVVLHLTKSMGYWSDQEAVRESLMQSSINRISQDTFDTQAGGPKDPRNGGSGSRNRSARQGLENLKEAHEKGQGRNPRSVLTPKPSSYSGQHYATYPVDLIRPLIKSSCPVRCCPACGAGWAPRIEKGEPQARPDNPNPALPYTAGSGHTNGTGETTLHKTVSSTVLDYRPTCACHAGNPDVPYTPGLCLDPFFGSGTTGIVARELGVDCIGLDLSYDYLHDQARARLGFDAWDAWHQGRDGTEAGSLEGLPLFEGVE